MTFEKGWKHLYFYNLAKKSFPKVIALHLSEGELISEAINPVASREKQKGIKFLVQLTKSHY